MIEWRVENSFQYEVGLFYDFHIDCSKENEFAPGASFLARILVEQGSRKVLALNYC